MKNIGLYLGSYSVAGIGVFEMQNWNPFTIAFWATLTGICFYSLIGGALGAALFKSIKHKIKQWHGTGQTQSKEV